MAHMSRNGRPVALVSCLAVAAIGLPACGIAPSASSGDDTKRSCLTTVRGVVSGAGALYVRWLPAEFGRPRGGRSTSALPGVEYLSRSAGSDSSSMRITTSRHRAPISRADAAGRSVVRWVSVRGHRGLIASGPPDAAFIGVYFKPSPSYLISVIGYELPAAAVLKTARHASFAPPGITSLPMRPGPIVSRSAAVAAVRRSIRGRWHRAVAKLTSWTETATVLAAHTGRDPATAPDALRAAPWRPVWAVRVTRHEASGPAGILAVVDAATGKAVYSAAARTPWFAALTDRARWAASGRCQGGSSARLPFGVLTRTEETFTVGGRPAYRFHDSRNSTRLVLSTVRAVNHAEPSMYGGCVQQDCSVSELVWVTIATARAAPGRRLPCMPPSYPVGYHRKKVQETFSVSVPDNYEFGCGVVPAPIRKLKDLAPPTSPVS